MISYMTTVGMGLRLLLMALIGKVSVEDVPPTMNAESWDTNWRGG